MTVPVPAPRDFAIGYSPLADADLVLWVVDERPPSPWSPRGAVRAVRGMLRRAPRSKRDANDVAAERAWAAIAERPTATPADAFAEFLADHFANDHLRKFEYAFLARALARSDVRTDVVVDMGGGNAYSTVVPIVCLAPRARIISVDVVNRPSTSKYGVEYIKGDCGRTPLPDASADVVALISTLEHVGLGRWGDPLDVDGDLNAMREAWRVLRPGGHAVVTVPYGFPTVVFNLHRIYDAGRIRRLADGFTLVHEEYSLLGRPASRDDVEGARLVDRIPGLDHAKADYGDAPQIPGGGMFLLRKPGAVGDKR